MLSFNVRSPSSSSCAPHLYLQIPTTTRQRVLKLIALLLLPALSTSDSSPSLLTWSFSPSLPCTPSKLNGGEMRDRENFSDSQQVCKTLTIVSLLVSTRSGGGGGRFSGKGTIGIVVSWSTCQIAFLTPPTPWNNSHPMSRRRRRR